MRIVFIRVHKDLTKPAGTAAKESSSSKGIIAELERQGLASGSEEWRFSFAPPAQAANPVPTGQGSAQADGLLPVRTFDATAPKLEAQGASADIIWVEGSDHPPYLQDLFTRWPESVKLVYSKDWKPEKIQGLESYDLCLVDEVWQVQKLAKRGVRAAVWDKLVDYEGTHRPLGLEKRYDLCYVAYLRRRKQHELLFHAMAQVRDRKLTCVCVGGDPDGRLPELRALVAELGIDVTFAGDVPKADVNRYVNESRIGVMCSLEDAAPRAILEYMAADVPVLVTAELLAGKRYVGERAGLVSSSEALSTGITTMLDSLGSWAPREYLLKHFSRDQGIQTFVRVLRDTASATGKRIELGKEAVAR